MKPDYKKLDSQGNAGFAYRGNGAVPCAAARFRRIRHRCERKAARRAGSGIRRRLCRLCKVHRAVRVCLSELFL